MGRHSKEWNEGYQAAIEAIKQAKFVLQRKKIQFILAKEQTIG